MNKSQVLLPDKFSYDFAVRRGCEPLIDSRFKLPIKLRVEIQKELFGKCIIGRGNIPQANDRFYRWVFSRKGGICEETGQPIHSYAAVHVSHIYSRGAHPEMAHDPRNTNILIVEKHTQWENERKRKGMKIYRKNIEIMELLKNEYKELRICKI